MTELAHTKTHPLHLTLTCFRQSWQAHTTFDQTLLALYATFFIAYLALGYLETQLVYTADVMAKAKPTDPFIHAELLEKGRLFSLPYFFLLTTQRVLYGPCYLSPHLQQISWRAFVATFVPPLLCFALAFALWIALPSQIQGGILSAMSLQSSAVDTLLYGTILSVCLAPSFFALVHLALLFPITMDTGKLNFKQSYLQSKGHMGILTLLCAGGLFLSILVSLPLAMVGALDTTTRPNPTFVGATEPFFLMNTWFWENPVGQCLTYGVAFFLILMAQSVGVGALAAFYKHLKEDTF